MTKEISFCWEVGGPSGFSEAEVREALLSLRDAGVPVLMSPPLLDAEGRLVAGTGGPLSPVLSDVDGAPTGRYRFVLVQSYEEAEEDELHRRVFPAKAERLAASEKAREEAERRFAVISPAGHAIDYAAWVAAMDQIERHRLDFTNCADVGRRMEVRALAAVSRAARLQYQIEREIVFLEEEAATGVSFYEATFTQRAQALRASIAAEEEGRDE